MADTQQCPNCGAVNEADRALCKNCQTPLTAYAGQLQGEVGSVQRQRQIEDLTERPPAVAAMALFDTLFAVFWPLASVICSFMLRSGVNSEGTNYLSAAFSTVGPIFTAFLLIPIAGALLFLAWATFTQQIWSWTANLVVLGAFILNALTRHGFSVLTFIWAGLAIGMGYFWFQPRTKAWYGL